MLAAQLIENGIMPWDAWLFTIGEAAVYLRGVRWRDELEWIRMGTIISNLIAVQLPKGKKGPKASDYNPYAKPKLKGDAILSQEQIDDIKAVLVSDRAKKLDIIHRLKKENRGKRLSEYDIKIFQIDGQNNG